MKCPNCNVNLVLSDRNGIEIDYCPDCRGIWLDRGELDKIIERSSKIVQNTQSDSYRDHQEYSKGSEHQNKKKKSLLGDFFDKNIYITHYFSDHKLSKLIKFNVMAKHFLKSDINILSYPFNLENTNII